MPDQANHLMAAGTQKRNQRATNTAGCAGYQNPHRPALIRVMDQVVGQHPVPVIKHPGQFFLHMTVKRRAQPSPGQLIRHLISHNSPLFAVWRKQMRMLPAGKGSSDLPVFEHPVLIIIDMLGFPCHGNPQHPHVKAHTHPFVNAVALPPFECQRRPGRGQALDGTVSGMPGKQAGNRNRDV